MKEIFFMFNNKCFFCFRCKYLNNVSHSLFAGALIKNLASEVGYQSWIFIVITHSHVTLTFGSKAEKDTHNQEEFVEFSCFNWSPASSILTFDSSCRRFGILVTNSIISWVSRLQFFRTQYRWNDFGKLVDWPNL